MEAEATGFRCNRSCSRLFLSVTISLALATMLAADTCREVGSDASGRVVQTVERRKDADGTVLKVCQSLNTSSLARLRMGPEAMSGPRWRIWRCGWGEI